MQGSIWVNFSIYSLLSRTPYDITGIFSDGQEVVIIYIEQNEYLFKKKQSLIFPPMENEPGRIIPAWKLL
jgi:hypothetical protein